MNHEQTLAERLAMHLPDTTMVVFPIETPDGVQAGGELITRTSNELVPVDLKAEAFAALNATVTGRGVMAALVAHQARHAMELVEYPYLSINVSARVLGVETEVALAGSDPHRIKLELTEDAMLDLVGLAACERLAAKGYRWMLDDLGSGYHDAKAYPTYLRWLLERVAFGAIKLDYALVTRVFEVGAMGDIMDQLRLIRPFVAAEVPLVIEGVPRVRDGRWAQSLYAISYHWGGPVLYQLPAV